MKKGTVNRRVFTIALAALLGLFLMLAILPPVHHPPRAASMGYMKGVSEASKHYHNQYNAWPKSLTDLTNNPRNLVFFYCEGGMVDGWRRPLLYQPFDPAKGYGAVISYGRDGRPGGSGEDADLEVRFGADQ
jgi:hypothetical protein